MPMAGEGNRFKDKGYDVPKPIIIFEGKELYRHALDSIYESSFIKHLKDLKIKHTFIVRQEFIDNFRINERIKNLYPEVIQEYNYDYDTLILISNISNSGVSAASSARSAAESYSSGGGGFSSGGGFGGGGGGGGRF